MTKDRMHSLFRHRTDCRLCHSDGVEVVVPLRPIPVATPNTGLPTQGQTADELASALVPLDLYLCRNCGHLQLLDIIDPEVQYNNFAYTTSISLGLTEHFGRLAEAVIARGRLSPGALVVEVGSNDGTLLRFFKDRGMRVLGIDPARATAMRATAEGIETLPTFFTEALAEQLCADRGPAAVVISNNTYANLDDLDGPTAGIRKLLAPDGLLVFETQHGADVIRRMLVDTIYHEHLSYFLVGPLLRLVEGLGAAVARARRVPVHGGSLRLAIRRGGLHCPEMLALAEAERRDGLQDLETYRAFARRVGENCDRLHEVVHSLTSAGVRVVGYGASAKGNTLLNRCSLPLAYIVDDNPLKHGYLTPGRQVLIRPPQAILEESPGLHVLLLAWNFAGEIVQNLRAWRPGRGDAVIRYIPEVSCRAVDADLALLE